MRSDTLKSWLQEKGCRFAETPHERGQGHSSIVVKLGDKETTLPHSNTHEDLKPEEVQQIVQDLGLENEELPGGEDYVGELYKNKQI